MKFLVLGCNGMAGHTVSLYLFEQGHDVLGFSKSKSNYFESVEGDAFDTQLLRRLVTNNNFDSIINCIGVLNDFAETSKASAIYLNSYLPHFLAEITQNSDTQIIQMSTDCVFSGKRGNYKEYDFRDGDTFYDRSKALGELNDNKNITLRNSIIGPDINSNGIGLLNWFMQQHGGVKGYKSSIWTGQTTLQLAKTMEYAAKEKASGLINAVPESSISKYDLLKLLNKYLRNKSLNIIPVEGITADKSLKRTNYDFIFQIPTYETMIAEMAVWIKNHKKLYPHYNINF